MHILHGRLWAAFFVALFPSVASAQASGSPVLNQGRHFVAVTPSDSTDLTLRPTRGVFVAGTAGGLACVLVAIGIEDGTTATTFSNVQPGSYSPIAVKRIQATNTTCVGIVAVY